MQVGERVIEGMIKERGEARRTYEAAKTEGRKTSLVEQERPNMFTTSVANIGPGEEIVVTIEYQETLRYDDGTFRLRFPLAITPRYIPGQPVESTGGGMGWSPATQQVLDADRITPPVADRHEGYVNPVKIAIDLRAGFPLAQIASTYHRVNVEEEPGHRYRLTLADGPIPAARDFELAWTPDVGAAPGAALFTETRGGKTYALLMALPPSSATAAGRARAPRDHVHRRHVGLDGRRVDRAGARRAADGARPPAARRPLQRHRIQLDRRAALPGAGPARRSHARAGEAVRGRPARARRHRDAARARARAGRPARSAR